MHTNVFSPLIFAFSKRMLPCLRAALQKLLEGDTTLFMELASEVPDGEVDVVAVLKPEDLPLVRKVRRRFIAAANPHAIDFYKSFTDILMTLVWKQGEKVARVRQHAP